MKADSGRAVSKIERSSIEIASWIGLAAYLALVIGFASEPTPLAQALAGIGIAIAFVHAARVYGWKDAAVLAIICLGVTFTMENIGDATGFPFGRYHFAVGANLPHVGTIPIIVGPLWFGMGYFSWIVAGTLLSGAETRLNRKFEVVARPIVAALVMTQWDLVMDPPLSTISKAWIWHDGGAHFGVPLSNYLGWLLTAWLFYQAFAIYLSRRQVPVRTIGHARALRLAAVLLYLASGLAHVTPWVIGQSGGVVDAAGHVWRIQDIREATVATVLFTMFFTSVLAIMRLATDDRRSSRFPDM